MATNTLKKLFQVQLGAGDTLVYTAPALTRTTVVALYIVNTDTVDRTFRLHQVNSGGAISNTNALYFDQPVTAKRTLRDGGIIFEPGQLLRGLASAGAVVNVAGFGIETSEAG